MATQTFTVPENRIAADVVDACILIHRKLGPGLLESTYQKVLAFELRRRGHSVELEVPVPLLWEGEVVEEGAYRVDQVVDNLVVLELKSTQQTSLVHHKQAQTSTCLLEKRLGMLLNFGLPLMKDGIFRKSNGLPEEPTDSA